MELFQATTSQANIRKPRKCLSLKDKIDIIRDRQNGVAVATLATKYEIDRSTITKIVRQKEALLKTEASRPTESTKKVAREKFGEINEAVLKWVNSIKDTEIDLQASLIQEKAMFFAKEFKNDEFVASRGWLDKFLKRNKLVRDLELDLMRTFSVAI